MYVARATWPSSNGKSYESIHLRESYRDGARVRKRDIANLTHCDPREIAAIELALKFKGDLSALGSLLLSLAAVRLFLRRLYGLDPLYGLLLTFGAALVLEGIFQNAFGISGNSYPVKLLPARSASAGD